MCSMIVLWYRYIICKVLWEHVEREWLYLGELSKVTQKITLELGLEGGVCQDRKKNNMNNSD